MPKRKISEASFQITVADWLGQALKRTVLWTAFPAGGGGFRRGALLKRMGLKRGWPDIILLNRGKLYGLELKTIVGVLSAEQRALHAELAKQGVQVAVCRRLDEVTEAISGWGLTSPRK